MPRLSIWFVRSALVSLASGFTLGALLLSNKGVPFAPWIWRLLPLHIELLLTGWLIQLAMGVAFWILPRFGRGVDRGDERPIWAAWGLLNLGIVLVMTDGWLTLSWLGVAGRLCELAAVVAYVLGSWKRVRPFDYAAKS